jgi:hypothetical protein
MNFLQTTKRRVVAAAIVGGVVVAGAGTAAYGASTPTPSSTSPGAPAAAPPAHLKHRSLLERADHATLEVRQKGQWVTITVDRGNVTALTSASITLARPDGQSVTLALGPTTKYRGKEATSAAALKTGLRAEVTSMNGTALSVAEGAKPLSSK